MLKKKGAELIGGTMVGITPKELEKEFQESRCLNPAVQRPVCHVSLSLEPGLHLDDDIWNEIVEKYMERMGFTQYFLVKL